MRSERLRIFFSRLNNLKSGLLSNVKLSFMSKVMKLWIWSDKIEF